MNFIRALIANERVKAAFWALIGAIGAFAVQFFGLLSMLLLMLSLSGCVTRDAKVKEGQAQAEKHIRNYQQNQHRLHAAEQKAFAVEAKSHIDTKYLWQMETVQRTAEQKALTPAQIVTEAKRLTFLRDDKRSDVDAKVAGVKRLQDLSERDLENFFRLESAIKRYDDEEGFNPGSLLNSLTSKDEPAAIVDLPPESVFVDPKPAK